MLGHFDGSTTILTGHYSRDISRFARPFGCIARKLANDQLLFCALYVAVVEVRTYIENKYGAVSNINNLQQPLCISI